MNDEAPVVPALPDRRTVAVDRRSVGEVKVRFGVGPVEFARIVDLLEAGRELLPLQN